VGFRLLPKSVTLNDERYSLMAVIIIILFIIESYTKYRNTYTVHYSLLILSVTEM